MRSKITIGFFVILIATFSFAFRPQDEAQGIQQIRKSTSDSFYISVQNLTKVSESYSYGNASLDELQMALRLTRNSYKKVEFLVGFYFPSFVERHINGAPLLHVERYGTRPLIQVPEGLQVLDEMIHSDEVAKEKAQIAILAATLESNSFKLLNGLVQQPMTTKEVLEACRVQLIRIYTLGLTGFDTPGSLNGIEESKHALETLQQVLSGILHQSGGYDSILKKYFQLGIEKLNNESFSSLDRLAFLKEIINPLFLEIQNVKESLNGIEGKDNWLKPMARNTTSTNLFSEDFLDPYYYTELTREEDNIALKSLGELLFFDPILSANETMSCASCHDPEQGFADGLKKSQSNILGKTVQRNAPTLLNAVYSDRYFYDLRAFSLEQQAEHVIFNTSEFNTAYDEILQKLSEEEKYVKQFKVVFGKSGITQDNFKKALVSYVLSLQSFNSTFDKYVRNEIQELDPLIKEGYNLFMGKAACGTCHFAPTFAGLVPPLFQKNESEILGILDRPYEEELDGDSGRIANKIYSESAWIHERSFKTSTVRNVEKTAPYFHNGEYETLEEVVDFYDHGGGAGIGLNVVNQTLSSDSLHLQEHEKKAIIEFMKSLTEEE